MILWYKNSFLASVASIFGSGLICCAVFLAVDGEFAGLVLAIPGVLLCLLGKNISENKSFKKWWKQVTDANLEPRIAVDYNLAVNIYNKNPQKRTLNKIAQLNPGFAQRIQQSVEANKKKK